jgi:hypothetical protein
MRLCRVHKHSPIVQVLSQMKPVLSLQSFLLKIRFNITLPRTYRYFTQVLSHSPVFSPSSSRNHPNNISHEIFFFSFFTHSSPLFVVPFLDLSVLLLYAFYFLFFSHVFGGFHVQFPATTPYRTRVLLTLSMQMRWGNLKLRHCRVLRVKNDQ